MQYKVFWKNMFKNDFPRKMKENKILGMNSLLKNMLKKLW